MLQAGRPPVPHFPLGESLYLRYGIEEFVDGQLALGAIRFPEMSVNRGSLSEPEDALFSEDRRYDGLGVVAFKVADVPGRIDQENGPAYVFFLRHAPLEDNYSHSEICSAPEAQPESIRPPSNTVKLKFRIELSKQIKQDAIRITAVRRRR